MRGKFSGPQDTTGIGGLLKIDGILIESGKVPPNME
jgi:hypothetical protein